RQIARHNPKINAFVVLLEEEARKAAQQAEAAVTRGETPGLLHGVPVTAKDSFDLAGLPTLCGSKFRLGHRAAEDATAVARLRPAALSGDQPSGRPAWRCGSNGAHGKRRPAAVRRAVGLRFTGSVLGAGSFARAAGRQHAHWLDGTVLRCAGRGQYARHGAQS